MILRLIAQTAFYGLMHQMGKRVRFLVNRLILTDVLGGGNPVHDHANLAVCRAERARIEAACMRAFASRPAD
jgi:hypothetical protein